MELMEESEHEIEKQITMECIKKRRKGCTSVDCGEEAEVFVVGMLADGVFKDAHVVGKIVRGKVGDVNFVRIDHLKRPRSGATAVSSMGMWLLSVKDNAFAEDVENMDAMRNVKCQKKSWKADNFTQGQNKQRQGQNLAGRIMAGPFDFNDEEIKEALQNNDIASAVEKINDYLDQLDQIPLNVAVTGVSGSGKSTFVNAFRGISNKDEGAAPTGPVETTKVVTSYPHPVYPNVLLWDLPGIGTTTFLAAEYLKKVEFEKFDFFIIISADRFRENDVKLAKEIQRMGKKFYFVRSKIDHNIRDEENSQRDFNAEQTLGKIKNDCIQGLKDQGFENPQVFLVSSPELHLYDFHLLEETLEKELPAHKRAALLFAMPNISLEIINKKKEALQANILFIAFISSIVACVPVPGLSLVVDLSILGTTAKKYKDTLGLDDRSLQNLARSAKVPVEELRAEMLSPLAREKIETELIVRILCTSSAQLALIAAEEGFRVIPVIGSFIAGNLSCVSTYNALTLFLDMLADNAQRVFKRALGLDTSE
ncbi:interferon-inducible GTPase 5-like [Cheilinus undulatus]|uniref:interferon-inducible GTPase 5-like n=1 Tax=Cheilinus undulatus TaxID=241271 RepID=UPI001BD3420E|nr:interferon-inducible GTPase 5-like [Cheilinus undulatus]